jgi:hypothetical protein
MVLPREPHTFLEIVALINREAALLNGLREESERRGHRVGVYYTCSGRGDERIPVYIHAKLLLVDHRFLTVGSANLADRSMGLDTELNVSWEGELETCLRRAAGGLLAEHTGRREGEVAAVLPPGGDLVGFLNECAADDACGLHTLTEEVLFENHGTLRKMLPGDFAVDPDRPLVERGLHETLADSGEEFARGVGPLRRLFADRGADPDRK